MKNKMRLGLIARIALVVAILFTVIRIFNLQVQIHDLDGTQAQLEAEISERALSVEELREKLEWPLNEETIKRFAREKLNLRDPGDILFASDMPE